MLTEPKGQTGNSFHTKMTEGWSWFLNRKVCWAEAGVMATLGLLHLFCYMCLVCRFSHPCLSYCGCTLSRSGEGAWLRAQPYSSSIFHVWHKLCVWGWPHIAPCTFQTSTLHPNWRLWWRDGANSSISASNAVLGRSGFGSWKWCCPPGSQDLS